jgi:formylglycine-generating enzyme required for sulfatase activity
LKVLRRDYADKEAQMIQYFEKNKIMTRAEMIAQLKLEIEKVQSGHVEVLKEDDKKREEQKKEIDGAVIDGHRMVFHRIEPGPFEMGEVGDQIPVKITKPFEMVATVVTQVVWNKIVTAGKRKFPRKYNALNADPSEFKGDLNPVEYVSYHDIVLWLQAVNKLSQAGDPVVEEIMPGHKMGAIYRLPTEAEWEFVARTRGASHGAYHFGDNESDLATYAWYVANSGGRTHPVATKDPLVIDGQKFYDMHGNVWEWTADAYKEILPGGKDPFVKGKADSSRVIRGGCWSKSASRLRSAWRDNLNPDFISGLVGARLVRTVP